MNICYLSKDGTIFADMDKCFNHENDRGMNGYLLYDGQVTHNVHPDEACYVWIRDDDAVQSLLAQLAAQETSLPGIDADTCPGLYYWSSDEDKFISINSIQISALNKVANEAKKYEQSK